MNSFKKIFCRAYQTVFHAALPFLPYREPERLGSVAEIPAQIEKNGHSRVLLITDEFLRKSGGTKPLEDALEAKNIHCAVYDGTRANPTVEMVEEAVRLYRAESCQCLIGFGGGSSIDCAKAAGARIVYPKRSVNQLGGTLKIFRKLPKLFAIPTTAGTGSEVTLAAVITDAATKHKYPMNSFPLIPRYAVLDPAVTFTLPPHLTATTGMDALTHAVEAYIGRSTSRETRRLAEEAVCLIFANIEKAYRMPEDETARKNMLDASYKAGLAFSKSYVGYVHAVAHSLGGQYNIPHGLANAVLLPVVLREYGAAVHKKLHRMALLSGIAAPEDSRSTAAGKFIAAIADMNAKMGIPATLAGIRAADIPVMARHADREANPLYPVPKLMDAKALEKFYYMVMEGENGHTGNRTGAAGVF